MLNIFSKDKFVYRLFLTMLFMQGWSCLLSGVEQYLAVLGNGELQQGKITRGILETYQSFKDDILLCSKEKRRLQSISIDGARYYLNTIFFWYNW